jgi:HEPN domain-containing protein
MRHDPNDPEAWHDYAEEDLQRAHRRLAEGDLVDCLVHLEQCAEKAMKGKLIELGWGLQKTHNLVKLADELLAPGVDVKWFAETGGLLLAGYIGDRYPGLRDESLDHETAKKAVEETAQRFAQISGRKQSK